MARSKRSRAPRVTPAPVSARDPHALFVQVLVCVEALRRAWRALPELSSRKQLAEFQGVRQDLSSCAPPGSDAFWLYLEPCQGEIPCTNLARAHVLERHALELEPFDMPGVVALKRIVRDTAAALRRSV